MKKLNILIITIFSCLLVGCGTTPEFNKRKYTKGKFRIHHKLKKYRASSKLQEEKEGAEKQIQESQNRKKEQQDSLHDPERNSEPGPSKVKLRAFVPEKKVKEDNEAVYWSQSRKELSSPVSETSESKEEVELPKEIHTEEDGKMNRSEVRANIALILTTISLLCLYNFPLMLLGLVFGLTGFVFAIYAFTDKARTRKAKNRAIISGVAFILFALVISGLIFWITLIDPMVLSFWV